jgi:hypothetical protein
MIRISIDVFGDDFGVMVLNMTEWCTQDAKIKKSAAAIDLMGCSEKRGANCDNASAGRRAGASFNLIASMFQKL